MKKMTICVIGAFKHGCVDYNGQTTKVRNYAAEIKARFPDAKVIELDTWRGDSTSYTSILKAVPACLKSDVVLILPGKNGLKIFLPLTSVLKKLGKYLLLYPVVGGWLPEYVQSNQNLAKHLKNVDRVYVETNRMVEKLQAQGMTNIELAPVFTRRTAAEGQTYRVEDPIALCTFSRVTEEKGVGTAIEAVQLQNKAAGKKKYCLNVYGQIDPAFEETLKAYESADEFGAVCCHGPLEDSEVIETLARHSALLFPTYYPGEGFPATVQEAMIAGLPIVASDWRYNGEIVTEGYNGYLFDLSGGARALAEKIEALFASEQTAVSMHQNSLERAEHYTPKKVLAPMFERIAAYCERSERA
ncbi:MAG: glycosyltransferase [Oscillospiraceae bacterium]|nr:glycosyltransferase [Oscillospiraceae bacterium]